MIQYGEVLPSRSLTDVKCCDKLVNVAVVIVVMYASPQQLLVGQLPRIKVQAGAGRWGGVDVDALRRKLALDLCSIPACLHTHL